MYTKRIPLTFLIAIVILITAFQPLSNVQAAPNQGATIPAALAYLQSQQQPDGGLPGQSGASDVSTTARALLAFAAVQQDPSEFRSSQGSSPVDYLLANYPDYIVDDNGLLFPGMPGWCWQPYQPPVRHRPDYRNHPGHNAAGWFFRYRSSFRFFERQRHRTQPGYGSLRTGRQRG